MQETNYQEVKMKSGPKFKFSNPHIYPKWGPIPPIQKFSVSEPPRQ